MPNVFGPLSDEQVSQLIVALQRRLSPSEHDGVVITQITDQRARNDFCEIRASDECSLGTRHRVRQAMIDVGTEPARIPYENPTFDVPTVFTFGGAEPIALELPFPVFQSEPLESLVINLKGEPQPYVAVYGAHGRKTYDDFLMLVHLLNVHAEVEVYWPKDQYGELTHMMSYHRVRTFSRWVSENKAD